MKLRNLVFFALSLVCFLLTSLPNSLAQPNKSKTLDKIIGNVGDKIIMQSDLEEMMRYHARNKELPQGADCLLMEQLLTQQLLLVQAERDSIKVTDEEIGNQVEGRIDEILRMMGGDRDQFFAYYGITPQQMKTKMFDDMRNQLLVQRMQNQINEKVLTTPSEVSDFFNKIPKDSLPFFNTEIELSQIVAKPKINAKSDLEAKNTIEELRNKIIKNEATFEDLAKKFSEDKGSGAQGGDLGWANRGSYVPEFESTAYRLKNGELSLPVKTKFGYHIIYMNERRGNSVSLKHILVRPKVTQEDLNVCKAKLDTIRQALIKTPNAWAATVRDFTEDEYSKNSGGDLLNPKSGATLFEIGDLDVDLFMTIDSMKVGQISNPVEYQTREGDLAYRIIRIKSKSEPHQANLRDDYARIQIAATNAKKDKIIRKWMTSKLGTVHVTLHPPYDKCVNLAPWLKKKK